MTHATLFDHVMRALWGDEIPDGDFLITALYNRIRGQNRINPENALDVLDMMGPTFVKAWEDARVPDDVDPENTEAEIIYTIRFWDDSSALVISKRGQGMAVEVL